jgi:hypothetical protein
MSADESTLLCCCYRREAIGIINSPGQTTPTALPAAMLLQMLLM